MVPGTQPNGLFWTTQIPRAALVHNGSSFARLRLRTQPLVDTFVFGGSLAISASADIDVVWRATGEPVERGEGAAADPTSPAAFAGRFAEARCVGTASAVETGVSFETGELTTDAFFAELGTEQNGIFLS